MVCTRSRGQLDTLIGGLWEVTGDSLYSCRKKKNTLNKSYCAAGTVETVRQQQMNELKRYLPLVQFHVELNNVRVITK